MTGQEALDLVMGAVNEHFPIVHVLRGGYPSCGFNLQRPEKWPAGHKWVSWSDPDKGSKVTCPECTEALKADAS